MKRYIIITVAAALCAMLAIVFISARPVSDTYAAQQHLKQLGWKTRDIPEETETVVINADAVQYIKMQEEYGYDLKAVFGQTASALHLPHKELSGKRRGVCKRTYI